MAEIVIVDDEPDIRIIVSEVLGHAGHCVRAAADGAALWGLLDAHGPDLVLLDVVMPGEDGFTIARRLRERYAFGIIMLTASATVVDRVVGLEIGADDYIVKPFEPRELLARIEAVLRRRTGGRRPKLPPGAVRIGPFVFDRERRQLSDAEGACVALTAKDAELLAVLATHRGKVLTRETLLELLPAVADEPFDRSIDSRTPRKTYGVERVGMIPYPCDGRECGDDGAARFLRDG
jgi:two-component system phosphate regulon response regulator OmpR